MISVVVPVYKVEKYLKKCVESIINQTYKDLEIILVDDGSPDNSGVICDEYAENDSRVRVIHKKNEGVAKAREDGIAVAKGEYICFVDSDDYIELDFCEVLLENLLKYNADWVSCDMDHIYENGDNAEHMENIESNTLIQDREIIIRDYIDSKAYPFIIWGKLFRTKNVKGYSFKNLKITEDTCFMVDMIMKTQSAYLTTYKGYKYVKRDGSVTSIDGNVFREAEFDRLKGYRYAYRAFSSEYPMYTFGLKKIIDQTVLNMYIQLIRMGTKQDRKKYRKQLRNIVKNRVKEQNKNNEIVSDYIRKHFIAIVCLNRVYDVILRAKHNSNNKVKR